VVSQPEHSLEVRTPPDGDQKRSVQRARCTQKDGGGHKHGETLVDCYLPNTFLSGKRGPPSWQSNQRGRPAGRCSRNGGRAKRHHRKLREREGGLIKESASHSPMWMGGKDNEVKTRAPTHNG